MSAKLKIYYYFLLGSFGGLTGWFIISLFPGINKISPNLLVVYALRGLILGGVIGISLAAYEGISNSSTRRFLKYAGIGLVVGCIGGAISLPFAQFLYGWFISGRGLPQNPQFVFLFGMLCWLLFGGIIGFIESIGKGTQSYKGFLGGAIGGVLGGLIYEIARYQGRFANEAKFLTSDYLIQACCFLLLGGFIGASLSLVTNLFAFAELEFLDGKKAGEKKDISKFVTKKSRQEGTVGSDSYYDNVYIPGDGGIVGRHATLYFENDEPKIRISEGAKKSRHEVLVNSRPIDTWALKNGDVIRLGSTNMTYRQGKKKTD